MKYEKLAKAIIENVGGKENVNSVVHCITRLRFKLKDEGKANTEVLENMDGVVTVRQSGGQYQVVIGNHVPDVYKAVVAEGGFESNRPVDDPDDKSNKGSLLDRFIDMISGIFQPILAVLVASGMIKGFNALFIAMGWLNEASGTYQVLNAIGDALFYFLPIFLGYTAMKKFGGTPFLGMLIAGALVYPALDPGAQAGEPLYTLFAGTLFESPVHIEFFGIPIILMTYAMSVIPIILSTFFAAKLENFFARIVPDVVKTFVVPMLTVLIIVPLTFILIGPIATWASQLLGAGTIWLYELSPVIAGAVVGAFWLVFVMFGLHWGLVPIAINNFSSQGWDPILALMFVHSFALAGALTAIWMRTKKQKLKTLTPPAILSAIFGVTEPGMYGIALPLKKPFIFTLIASGIGGALLGLFGTVGYAMGGLGIFQLPSFIQPKEGINVAFIGALIAAAVGTVLAFVLTYFFSGANKETEEPAPQAEDNTKQNVTSKVIESPLNGEVIKLADISDSAFASGALGKGVAIKPSEGKLISPVAGTVSALFDTQHAIGIVTEHGAELLVHIGMDTVQLEGKFFNAHVAQGDKIKKGQLLIEFDIEAIEKAGYDIATPVVITNFDQYTSIETAEEGTIQIGKPIIFLDK
ncbi:beta-glucoside-specific PTS transporter subunit IIABC [Virgibacillus pantothenticus]|uniref:beta-glucoside-specific PTS transporter subunit IIABC n=1 Tax=Virgibacillus pantothenticus TaxID=1473 RepID=UPI001C230906|nr:beta-glucoside-specific PTS transporter subunit IIABC [Virgibacillus pantothenticus]MBU8567698.1 beta-glucoside-specific PTS transporter subunit IIABC [Virgibacillus pantothenticus]MBU8602085.1 beta-glucoside-specific PTS transporter subunit IIABC [Virgibacillus pantothenticus]MBU8635722.1 beta-glucoside-specific PTS transporter subunit IIABC [Virgibacillus pantothenticus]MBU8643932.1 beta-glucoside-specific PTS transporter subunit IIABC [Virgibacillus pantothenticus]MBU8648196.1 beta-gluco